MSKDIALRKTNMGIINRAPSLPRVDDFSSTSIFTDRAFFEACLALTLQSKHVMKQIEQ